METINNTVSVILPIAMLIIYLLGLFYLIKTIIYVMRLPKQLAKMEKRIKQLEEKEENNG